MAITYDECLQALESSALRNRARVSVIALTNIIRTEGTGVTNHALRMAWAKAAALNPDYYVVPMLWQAIIQNQASAANLAAVTGAADSAVQTAINSAVDLFV